jgi:hypothetical protein
MIRIAITAAAYEAIADTLPFGNTMYEAKTTADRGRFIWPRRPAPAGRVLQRGHPPHDAD